MKWWLNTLTCSLFLCLTRGCKEATTRQHPVRRTVIKFTDVVQFFFTQVNLFDINFDTQNYFKLKQNQNCQWNYCLNKNMYSKVDIYYIEIDCHQENQTITVTSVIHQMKMNSLESNSNKWPHRIIDTKIHYSTLHPFFPTNISITRCNYQLLTPSLYMTHTWK